MTKGERIVVCGPSGSGKSTLIRCINRLEEHQKGQIIVDGIELTKDLKMQHEPKSYALKRSYVTSLVWQDESGAEQKRRANRWRAATVWSIHPNDYRRPD